MVGRVLNSRYALEKLIGSGGMADVYRATDNLLGRTVAVKILHPQYAKDEVFIARFRQEAQAAANLNQPNIVNVYDWGIENNTYYLVMEYVEGRDLKDIILQGGALLPERAVEIAIAISVALDAAHSHGVVHRDIKPQNIIVTYDNQIKVMDFGIARTTGGSAMTQTGTIMGTAQYISPEQAQGRAVDPRSDLYSLGVVLYEMLTGKPPFDGDNPVSIAYKHVREDPLPPSMINPDISPELEAVAMKALAKNTENRYQSAMEMCSDLERSLEGAPVYATPVLPRDEAALGATRAYPVAGVPPRRRSRAWIWLVVIALLLLAGLGVGVWALVGNRGVQVPNVTGMTVDQARRTLADEGLRLEVAKEVIDPANPKGVIISQDPRAGARIDENGTVEVVVSKGAEVVSVPDVVGMGRAEAEAALEAAGFKVDGVTESFSAKIARGKVASQNPEAGSRASRGSTVSLVVSKGPEMVSVPNVVGLSQQEAAARLAAEGLEPQVQTEVASGTTEGTVMSQDPASGATAPKGSRVIITVAKAPSSVPGVIGMTSGQAENTLSSAGFNVTVINQATPDSTKVGKVISQEPAAGSTASPGSRVKIYVGAAP